MPWRLLVVDGADVNRFFPLPDTGTVVIGNSHKFSDICLHDLIMARVHCQVDVEEESVTVTALADDKDTLVDGQKVTQHLMKPGEVLRIGNSCLRLESTETGVGSEEPVSDTFEAVDDGDVIEDVIVDDAGDIPEALAVAEKAEAVAVAVATPESKKAGSLDWAGLEQLGGQQLGHFEIGPVLGRGIHAVVFRARDVEAKREVALKVIGPEFPTDAGELKQFAFTIRQIAEINEKHLVRWWAAGKTSRYVWISQELIEGDSLAEMLKKNEPSSKVKWRNALKLGLDLAQALNCLARRRIVHGNLTPANVLIGLDRTAKLNDLMFEQALEGSAWSAKRADVKTRAILPFLAPERLEDKPYWNEVSDIYSLGALVYLRLTGRPPFQGATPRQTVELIREGRFEKPKKIIKECPMDFQAVIMKMLALNPEDRHQKPEELLNELESIQAMPTL